MWYLGSAWMLWTVKLEICQNWSRRVQVQFKDFELPVRIAVLDVKIVEMFDFIFDKTKVE